MTTDIRNLPGIWGIAQGKMPKRGPKALQYALDLTGAPGGTYTKAAPLTFDLTVEIMRDVLEFVQAVAIDNGDNNAALNIVAMVTGHRITCPSQSQGIFGLICPAGSVQFQAWGPAVKYNLLFMNIPYAPSVYKVT